MNHPAPIPVLRFDPLASSGPAPSPCIGICTMNARSNLCNGCQRTIPEIMAWGSASDTTRRTIWHAINARRSAPHND